MDELTKEEILSVSTKLNLEAKQCSSLRELLDLSYNFNFNDCTIKPHQNKEELSMLLELLHLFKPKISMEIGTSEGGTLFLLCKILDSNSKIISLDLPTDHGGGEFYPLWKENFYQNFVSENQTIHLLRHDSHSETTVDKIKEILGNKKLDFLLIDGDHSYAGVKKDFEMYKNLVAKDGIIAFHDINQEQDGNVKVKEFWDEIKLNYDTFEIIDEFLGIGYGIGVLVNSLQNDHERYSHLLKKMLVLERRRFEKMRDNPLSVLLWLFNERHGLQKHFPEVKNRDYGRLIDWALKTCESGSEVEKLTKIRIKKFYSWYKQYCELNKIPTK